MLADYGEGKAAFLSGTFNQISNPVVEITGEEGRILIGPEFWHPKEVELITNKGEKNCSRFVFSNRIPVRDPGGSGVSERRTERKLLLYTLEETKKSQRSLNVPAKVGESITIQIRRHDYER